VKYNSREFCINFIGFYTPQTSTYVKHYDITKSCLNISSFLFLSFFGCQTIVHAFIYPYKSSILNEAAMQTKRENYTNAIIDTISNNVRVRQRKSWRNHPI